MGIYGCAFWIVQPSNPETMTLFLRKWIFNKVYRLHKEQGVLIWLLHFETLCTNVLGLISKRLCLYLYTQMPSRDPIYETPCFYLPKFSTYHAFFFERASLLSGLFKYWQVGIKMERPKSLNDNILQFHHICLNVVQTTNALNIFHIKKKFLLKQCLCSFDIPFTIDVFVRHCNFRAGLLYYYYS